MRLGIDSYSYHRLLGELRRGEPEPPRRFGDGALDPLRHARSLGVEVVSLETCYLDPPGRLDVEALAREAGPLEVVFAWGAPNGLEFGRRPEALDDLLGWIRLARSLGHRLLRIVVAGPSLRGAEPVEAQLARTVEPLRRAAAEGLVLAIENHGDLRAAELRDLLERADRPELGVCFDTANAPRVGDDAVEAARLLAPWIRMVHLKDVEPPAAAADYVAGPRSVPYGEGVIPIPRVLDELRAAGFDGPLCVEIAQLGPGDDELELVERCVGWLRARLAE